MVKLYSVSQGHRALASRPGGGSPRRSWWVNMIITISPFGARVILKGFLVYLIVSRVALAGYCRACEASLSVIQWR